MTEQHTPDPHARLAFHQRCAAAVLAKIDKTYGINPSLPAATQQKLDAVIAREAPKNQQWLMTRAAAMMHSHLSDDAVPAINATAARITQRYAEAFSLNHKLRGIESPPLRPGYGNFYRWDNTRKYLSRIYTNHLSNLAEAELCCLGLTPHSAHRLHGAIIAHIIPLYAEAASDQKAAEVHPQQGPKPTIHGKKIPKSSHEIEAEIKEISYYWRQLARTNDSEHRKFAQHR